MLTPPSTTPEMNPQDKNRHSDFRRGNTRLHPSIVPSFFLSLSLFLLDYKLQAAGTTNPTVPGWKSRKVLKQ